MFKKLRIKFIIVAISAVTGVLGLIMAAINTANFYGVTSSADKVIDFLLDNGGEFGEIKIEPPDGGRENEPNGEREEKSGEPREIFPDWNKDGNYGLGPETPFETRYFTVKINGDDYSFNMEQIFSVGEEEAKRLAEEVVNGSERGNKGDLRYGKKIQDDGTFVVFVDCLKQLNTARRFLLYSILISLIGVLAVFGALVPLSGKILKPVADSYDKQRRFITDAGHELKTPLTVISANNELIALEYGENESTQAISKQVAKMNSLVRDLIELSKLQERPRGEMKDFSLSDALKDVADGFKKVIESQGKVFESEIDEASYSGDEKMMRRVFSLVLDNAVKYSERYILLKLVNEGKSIKISIENDCPWQTERNLDEVFERFYRSAESRASDIGGSGIGLSVAKEIVELEKGKISARGEKGKFILEIIL